jgi:hypothetical protein
MWGVTNAYTMPQRYNNPDYVPTPVTHYNPFVKAKPMGTAPDWDNLYLPVDGEVMTVTEILAKSTMPMLPEDLYEQFLKRCF